MSITVKSWHPSGHASIKQLQWCGVDYGETPAQQASRIVSAGDTSPWLLIVHSLGEDGAHSVFSQNRETVLASDFDMDYFTPPYEDLFETLNTSFVSAGIVPDKMIVDMEAPSPWDYFSTMTPNDAARLALMQGWYADTGIIANMTSAMQMHDPTDFDGFRENYQDWCTWFYGIQHKALRSIRDIARTAFGLPNLVMTNWGDCSGANFEALDPGGNPVVQSSVTSGWSAPIIYQDVRNLTNDLNKHRNWNAMLGRRNEVRALVDKTKATLWYPHCQWQSPVYVSSACAAWVWEQDLRMDIESGVENIIFWNPDNETTQYENDRMANIVSDYVGQDFSPTTGESSVPLDSSEITTGPRTIKYPTFQGVNGGKIKKIKHHGV